MESVKLQRENDCAVYIDAGTTNTRVWLAKNDEVLARATAAVGVRDTARDGSPDRLNAALRYLIARVSSEFDAGEPACIPSRVVAAGIITSSLGLVEIPHLSAPVGLAEISAAVSAYHFPEITHLPILLIPGERSGSSQCSIEMIGSADVIRGEETLCMGLLAQGKLKAGSTLLNLGSHWKVIHLDDRSRIAASVTSLSGEMIHAVQTQTILAGSLASERPAMLDKDWLDAGMREQRRSGLARALFCVRLLEQRVEGEAEQRYAYVVGSFLGADLDALRERQLLVGDLPVTISGAGAVAEAWRHALEESSIPAIVLSEADTEAALLAGLRNLAAGAIAGRPNIPGIS